MARKFILILFFCFCGILCGFLPCFADPAPLASIQESEQQISSQVMSPFCPGRLLTDCPSTSAAELRSSIRTMLEEGKSRDDIMQHLISLYGDGLLAAPPKEGFGLVAWTTPAIFFVLGALVVGLWLSAKARRKLAPSLTSISPEIQARINNEIR